MSCHLLSSVLLFFDLLPHCSLGVGWGVFWVGWLCLYSLVCQAPAIYGFFHKLGSNALSCKVAFIICNLVACIKTGNVIPFFPKSLPCFPALTWEEKLKP